MSCGKDESTIISTGCVNEVWTNTGCSGKWSPVSEKSPLYQSGLTLYNQDGTTNVMDLTNKMVGGLRPLMAAYINQNPSSCNNASEKNTTGNNISDILFNIQNLQRTEQDLINQLDIYTSSEGYVATDPKITEFVKNINTIADARIAMFNTISANANILQTGVSQSRTDLVSQMTLLQAVEDQLNQAKAKIDQLNGENDTKMRMVEINTYYGQRYEAQSNLMKKIILFCLPVLILFIFKKKGILPETIANYIIGIVIAVGAFIIMRNIWDIFTRTNMDFDAYDWKYEFTDTTLPPTIWEYNKIHFFGRLFDISALLQILSDYLGICVGGTCCGSGMTYDSMKAKCLVPPGTMSNKRNTVPATAIATATASGANAGSSNRNGFTTMSGLKGTEIESYFIDDKNIHNGISPFSYDMAYAKV